MHTLTHWLRLHHMAYRVTGTHAGHVLTAIAHTCHMHGMLTANAVYHLHHVLYCYHG